MLKKGIMEIVRAFGSRGALINSKTKLFKSKRKIIVLRIVGRKINGNRLSIRFESKERSRVMVRGRDMSKMFTKLIGNIKKGSISIVINTKMRNMRGGGLSFKRTNNIPNL